MTNPRHDGEVTPPEQVPEAFRGNGHGPTAVMAGLVQQLPQMLANAFASVLAQVPVQTVQPPQLKCARCALDRLAWMGSHQREIDAAQAAYLQAVTELASLPDDDPRKGVQPDFMAFMPVALRPGGEQAAAPVADGVVMVNGALWCMPHMPGAPGKTQLLVASASLSPSMLGALAA